MPKFSICDFDLESVREFIQYLEVNLGIEQIDVSRVHSFRVGEGGLRGLLKRKENAHDLCQRNLSRISIDVQARKNEGVLSEEHLAVYRSVYTQWKYYDDILISHIQRVKLLIQNEAQLFPIEYVDCEDDYDFPF